MLLQNGDRQGQGTKPKVKQDEDKLLFGKTYNLNKEKGSKTGSSANAGINASLKEEICKVCLEEVKQRGLQWDHCSNWYHTKCVGIDNKQYKVIGQMQDLDWYCKGCRSNFNKLVVDNKNLIKENALLHKENKILTERLVILEKRIEGIKTEIKEEVLKEVGISFGNILDEIKEREERKHRENHLIIYNIEEPSMGTAAEKERRDINLFERLFREGVKENDFGICSVIRLGKIKHDGLSKKPRPLLVKMRSAREKRGKGILKYKY